MHAAVFLLHNSGGRSTFLATKGTSSGLLEAALTVYGSKQLAACTELTLSGDEPGREWRWVCRVVRSGRRSPKGAVSRYEEA